MPLNKMMLRINKTNQLGKTSNNSKSWVEQKVNQSYKC